MIYNGALGAFEEVGHFAGGETVGGLLINFGDDVTGAEPSIVSGSANVRRHDDSVILAGSHDHADAIIFAALIFAKEGELASVKEIGMRIEHAQHARDGALIDNLVDIDGQGIVGLNNIEDLGEVDDRSLVIVGIRGSSADGRAIDGAESGREGEDDDDDYKSTAFSVHRYLVVYRG